MLLKPSLVSENFLLLRQALLVGLGIGLVPTHVVQDDVRRGDVMTTLDDWRLSGIYLQAAYLVATTVPG